MAKTKVKANSSSVSQDQVQVKGCSAKGEAVANITCPGRTRSFCRTREGMSGREMPEWNSPWFMGGPYSYSHSSLPAQGPGQAKNKCSYC